MKKLRALIKRNTKLFFKDKGLFFTSLITPLILLVLYASFLSKVYRDSFLLSIPTALPRAEELVTALVAGQLTSSILAVSCITVAFCSNMLMVQDKANGVLKDLTISPVRRSTLALSYYCSTLISTLTISLVAMTACLIYSYAVGFFMSAADIILLFFDVFLLVMFGTALSSVINFFLSTQGQISAVGSIVSSCYGFICGAYMPISQFSEGLQRVISFLPGTYATSLVRNHSMQGVFREMREENYPEEIITAVRDAVDCNLYFFDKRVDVATMVCVLGVSVIVLISLYVLLNIIKAKKEL